MISLCRTYVIHHMHCLIFSTRFQLDRPAQDVFESNRAIVTDVTPPDKHGHKDLPTRDCAQRCNTSQTTANLYVRHVGIVGIECYSLALHRQVPYVFLPKVCAAFFRLQVIAQHQLLCAWCYAYSSCADAWLRNAPHSAGTHTRQDLGRCRVSCIRDHQDMKDTRALHRKKIDDNQRCRERPGRRQHVRVRVV
jgi:hypothetical protein